MGANPSDFRVLARTEVYWVAVKPAPVRPSKMPARAHRERQKDPVARKTCFVPGVDSTIASVNSTQSLSLSVLGPFVLRANGCEVTGLPRKAQALLAFLALQPDRKIPREVVADLLWTHSGPDQARHSLRQTLVALRKTQAANLVSANADALWIEAGAVEVDACVLETGLADTDADAVALSESASRYGGALVGDLPAVSPGVDEWLRTERTMLTIVMSRLLRRLATTHVAAGYFAAAVETAARLVGLDTLDEAAPPAVDRMLSHDPDNAPRPCTNSRPARASYARGTRHRAGCGDRGGDGAHPGWSLAARKQQVGAAAAGRQAGGWREHYHPRGRCCPGRRGT